MKRTRLKSNNKSSEMTHGLIIGQMTGVCLIVRPTANFMDTASRYLAWTWAHIRRSLF
jgi:hypothetical protein